jgi:poly(3-hydroxybutyrate) depolymerase
MRFDMRGLRLLVIASMLFAGVPGTAAAQALTSLQSLRVQYNTRKATVRPEGELKAQIDAVDKELLEATRLGRTGEIRRLILKGTTLLSGRPWTDADDYAGSLVIRSDRVVIDSTKPYAARIEQIYSPAIQLEHPLTARVSLRERPAPASGAAAAAPTRPALVRELGEFDGIGRDLRDTPFALDVDLTGIPDGVYQLAVDMTDGTRELGAGTVLVSLRKGLDAEVARLEAAAARAPESVRDDILYPVDRMRNVNRGRLELRTFNPDKDFAAANTVAEASRSGRNPFVGKTGDFKRHYLLTSAGEIMPYRLYVPSSYSAATPSPLVVALHGLGGTEDSFFDNYEGHFPKLAEQHGYILVAPLGYRVDGSYGWGVGNPPADPNTRRVQERSEQDVMQVLQLVRQQYKIDESRIYLMGHSMGAIGTWKIAPKYPEIWAALGMFAGSGAPATLERIRHVPEFVVHGDADPTVGVQGSRGMVAKMKELAIEHEYIEVPGGGHSNVVAPNAAAMFDFFNAHRKTGRTTTATGAAASAR